MTDARITEAYVETLAKASTVSARLAESYLEAVIGGQSPRRVVEAYLEVMISNGGSSSPVALTGAALSLSVTTFDGSVVAGTKIPAALTGELSTVTVSAAAGTVVAGNGTTPVSLTGAVVAVTVSAPAGTVVAGSIGTPAALTGVVVSLSVAAPAGAVFTTSATNTVALGFGFDIAATSSAVTLTSSAADIGFGFDIAASSTTVAQSSADIGFEFGITALAPRTHINDPRTGKPQYQLRVVDDAGTPIADVALKATMSELGEVVNDPTEFGFTLPTLDPRTALVTPTEGQRPPTVQLWRGQYLAGWVDVLRAVPSDDGATTSFQCKDRRWTLENEHVGKSPLRNLITNGDFSKGDTYGTYGFDAGSFPAASPLHSVVSDDFSSSGYALELTGADKSQLVTETADTAAVFYGNRPYSYEPLLDGFLPGGQAVIDTIASHMTGPSPTVHIVGHTANDDTGDGMALSLRRAEAAKLVVLDRWPTASVTTEGKGYYQPVASNATEAGRAKNRRVEISYQSTADGTKSAQWRMVSAKITHPTSKRRPLTVTAAGEFKITEWRGPNLNDWAVRFTLAKASDPGTILKTETVSMDGSAGMESFEGSEVSLTVPADGVEYLLRAYYYAPAGTIRWIDIGMYPDDVLGFYGVDQALIVKALIEHAQDVTMGRATLNLTTNCRPTGVPRTREYLFRDRMPIATAVEEFPALNRGVDIDLVVTPTTRTVTTFYPRQGEVTSQVLALGHNVVRYEAPVDLTQCATSVVVQADSISAHRQEGHTADASRLGGMVLERIVKAEKETPYRDLQGAAVAELARFGGPFPLLSVECDPRHTSNLIDTVQKGDRVRAIINDGRTNIDGLFSVYERRLDPNTDALTYRLSQEV